MQDTQARDGYSDKMQTNSSRLSIRSTVQTVLVLLISALVALGIGPMLIAGVTDLGIAPGHRYLSTNVLIASLLAVIFVFTLLYHRRLESLYENWTRKVNIAWVLAGASAAACAAITIANIDNGNFTAWRYANRLESGSGVSKTEMREHGRFFTRLSMDRSAGPPEPIATILLDWTSRISGGEADVLVRLNAERKHDSVTRCAEDPTIAIVPTGRDQEHVHYRAPASDLCDQWQRIESGWPNGTSALQIRADRRDSIENVDVDIMVVNFRPHFQWFWTICVFVAITAFLALVFVVSANLQNRALTTNRQTHDANKRRVFAGASLLLFLVLGNAFTYWYVAQEKTIYTWDFSGYWTSSRNVSDFLRGGERKSATKPVMSTSSPAHRPSSQEAESSIPDPGAVAALIRNIRFAEYNISSNLPVAIVMALFGGSRMVYELSLFNVYAFAAIGMLILALRAANRSEQNGWPGWWPIVPVLTVFCLVPFWVPIVRGYMGVSVAAVNLAVIWLYFREPVRQIRTSVLILIGALLLFGVMLQRWNAYWTVGFFLMAFTDGVRELIERRQFTVVETLRSLRAPLVSGFAAVFLFASVAWPKVVRTATTDYADIFSAYQEDDGLASAFGRQIDSFGAGIFALIVISFVYLALRPSTRRISCLLGIQILYAFIHFSSTQTMGPHQFFILLPGIMVVLSLALVSALSALNRSHRVAGGCAIALTLLFGVASGKAVFMPSAPPDEHSVNRVLAQSYRPPLVRSDLQDFRQLVRYIDDVMEDSPADQGIYVLAGSQTLNAAHFKNIGASIGEAFTSAGRVLPSAVVDKRDGFPKEIADAYIVVTSNPVQLSRRASDQYVVSAPAQRLFNGTGIGAAFERLPTTFQLDGDVDAVVYRRIRPNSAAEIAELSDYLRSIYPDRADVYQ